MFELQFFKLRYKKWIGAIFFQNQQSLHWNSSNSTIGLHCKSSNIKIFALQSVNLSWAWITIQNSDWFSKKLVLNSKRINWVKHWNSSKTILLSLYCNSSNMNVCIAILQTQLGNTFVFKNDPQICWKFVLQFFKHN